MHNTDVVIIGAGLSGLHSAFECQKRGLDYILLEARDRLGGRILSDSHPVYHPSKPAIDLGPSWFWPGQTYMQALLTELQLTKQIIRQYGQGDALFEDNQGNIRRGVDGVSMAGAYRLQGGIGQLIYNLSANIPDDRYWLNAEVAEIELINEQIVTTVAVSDVSEKIKSRFVVLAMPPRVALQSIRFTPVFSEARSATLNHIATWMAGHAKICLLYENAFWRSQGLSGDVISHTGPLQEIHDASSDDGALNALFGFVNIQAQHRQGRDAEIKAMSIAQLARLFGDCASSPIAVYLKDWAQDKFTATEQDQQIQRFHPANDMVNELESSWNQQLIWSGSESASPHLGNNGFLEGALEASQRTSLYLAEQLK